jgi:hypothetical protein
MTKSKSLQLRTVSENPDIGKTGKNLKRNYFTPQKFVYFGLGGTCLEEQLFD